MNLNRRSLPFLLILLVILILGAAYFSTLQRHISGGESPYVDDVGEMQVALNVWGTIHSSGYPLYTILGNLFTGAARLVGVDPAVAPGLHSLLWTVIALAVFYALIVRLTGSHGVAASATLIVGLSRSVWMHASITEVYSMMIAFIIVLIAVALWGEPTRNRVLLLALIGGFGVAHHRLIALIAPALILAVWSAVFRRNGKFGIQFGTIIASAALALIGFIPYIYLPARALASAEWVYNDPSTLTGFLYEFTSGEFTYLMQPPADLAALGANITNTINILSVELTPPLFILSFIGMLWAITGSPHRFAARIAFTALIAYVLWMFILHRVVMPQAVAMPVVMLLVFCAALAADDVAHRLRPVRFAHFTAPFAASVVTFVVSAVLLVPAHYPFIHDLTSDKTGLNMIALARHVPRDGVMMFPWSPRYTAVAFSKLVTGENADLDLIPHTADMRQYADRGIYTSRDTFYRFPLSWWDERIGRTHLTSAADGLVEIRSALETGSVEGEPMAHGVVLRDLSVCADGSTVFITAEWGAERIPDADLSVYVHLLDAENRTPLAQADSTAPVYGWYPTTRWSAGEAVTDHFTLPMQPNAARVAVGMYEQPTPGTFVNYDAPILPIVPCDTTMTR